MTQGEEGSGEHEKTKLNSTAVDKASHEIQEEFPSETESHSRYASVNIENPADDDIAEDMDPFPEVPPSLAVSQHWKCAETERARVLWGFAIVVLIALSWAGSTQFAKSTYNQSFNAPYFTTWYSTIFLMAIYPFFMIPRLCEKKPWRLKTFFRESSKIFGPTGICILSFLRYTCTFTILFMGTNYVYIRALGVIGPVDVSALFSSCSAFVYIFSIIWLKEKFFVIRVTAVLLSIGGIVLMAYAEGFQGPSLVGVILSVLAALGAALYNVLFKRLVGNATSAQVALFLSMIGVCTMLLLWPLILVIHYTHYEKIDWSNMPWAFLNGTGVLGLVFNYLVNFGIAFTFPLFIALGTVLGIPINGILDTIVRDKAFGPYKIVAAVMIVISFLLMLIPNGKVEKMERKLLCVRSGDNTLKKLDGESIEPIQEEQE